MSKTEILEELRKLSLSDRREAMHLLLSLEEEQESLEFAKVSADLAFQELDNLEKIQNA